MLLKTILNRIQRYPGFVYVTFRLLDELGELRVEIDVEPRKGSRAICSGSVRVRRSLGSGSRRYPLRSMPIGSRRPSRASS